MLSSLFDGNYTQAIKSNGLGIAKIKKTQLLPKPYVVFIQDWDNLFINIFL